MMPMVHLGAQLNQRLKSWNWHERGHGVWVASCVGCLGCVTAPRAVPSALVWFCPLGGAQLGSQGCGHPVTGLGLSGPRWPHSASSWYWLQKAAQGRSCSKTVLTSPVFAAWCWCWDVGSHHSCCSLVPLTLPRDSSAEDVFTLPVYFSSDWLNEYWDALDVDDYRFVYMGPAGTW